MISVCWKWLGILIISAAVTVFAVEESSQSFTLDGRLYSDPSASTPLIDGNVQLKVQVLNQTQDCILYEETQAVNTTSSNGYFTIRVGAAVGVSKRSGNDSANFMAKVFSNTSINVAGKLVTSGASCSYTPASGDSRFVRIQMTPSDGVTRTLSPNMALDSVPSAVVAERAESLQGMTPASLLQVNTTTASLSQTNLENVFSTTNYPKLSALLGTNNTLGIPTVAGNPGSGLATGQIWYDSVGNVLKYYDGAIKTLGNNSGSVTSVTGGAGLTGGTITSIGTLSVNVGTGVGQVVQVQAGGKLPALDGSNLTNLNISGVTSVNVAMPAEFTMSGGPITTAGTVTATWASQAIGNANRVFATNDAGAGTPAFRALVSADIPSLDTSKIGTGILPIARGGTNSGTVLSNNRIMASSGGAIVELPALGSGQIFMGSAGTLPAVATLGSSNGINLTTGAGSLSVGTNATVTNTASALVIRDGSGNFSAGVVTNLQNILQGSTTGLLTLRAPASFASYALTLPGADGATGQVLTTNGSGLLAWGNPGGASGYLNGGNSFSGNATLGTNDNFSLGFKTNNTTKMTVDSAGNVGIGTAIPAVRLEATNPGSGNPAISGVTQAAGILRQRGGNGVIDSGIYANGSSWTQVADATDLSFNYNYILQPNGGKVGIGTTAPSESLTVAGNISVTGEITSKDFYEASVTIADGWAIGDFTQVVQAFPASAAASSEWEVHLSGTRGSWTEGSTYYIAGSHSGDSSWREAPQTFENGYTGISKCFTVDFLGNVNSPLFRIRAIKASSSCGSGAPLQMNFRIRSIGNNTGWTSLSATGTGASVVGMQSMGLSWSLYTGNPRDTNGNLAIYANSFGNVGIGTTSPSISLDVGSKTDAIRVPSSTTANRPATPSNGMIRYNTDNNKLEGYVNGAWQDFTAATTGGTYLSTSGGTLSGALTVGAGGANITGGINNNGGGITNSGSITGSTVSSGTLILDSTSNATKGVIVLAPTGGNVGIGTMSPTDKLKIQDSVDALLTGSIFNTSDTANAGARFMAHNGGSAFALEKYSMNNYVGTGARSAGFGGLVDSDKGINMAAGSGYGVIKFYSGGLAATNERARIDALGNVGIGTTSPGAKLDIFGGIQASSGEYLNGNLVNGGNTSLILGNSSGETYAVSAGVPNASESGFSINKLTGYTYGSNIQAISTPVLTIRSGNVGIGTTSASTSLMVSRVGAGISAYVGIDADANQQSAIDFRSAGAQKWAIYRPVSSNDLRVYDTAGTADRMTFQSNTGFVGIGTTNPQGLFQVHASTDNNLLVRGPLNLANGISIYSVNDANSAPRAMELGATSYYFSGGAVGIGTSSPHGIFDIKANTNQHINVISDTNGAFPGAPGIMSVNDANSAYTPIGIYGSTIALLGGNVGIGTTSPTTPLEIDSAVGGSQQLTLRNTSTAPSTMGMTIRGDSASNGSARNWAVLANSAVYGDFTVRQSNALGGDPTTAGTDRFYINPSGNVGIGTANPTTAKLVISGTAGAEGLDLASADQYANLRVIHNTTSGDLFLGFNSGATSALHLYSNNAETATVKGGNVGIGTTSPAIALDVGNRTDAIRVPTSTTANRPSTPSNGMIRYNTDNNKLEGYVNGAWQDFSAAATGGAYLATTGGTLSGALVVSAGGANISGGINNNGGGITNSGSLTGSTVASGTLVIDSTSNATKGVVALAPSGGWVGIGTIAPGAQLSNNSLNTVDVVSVGGGSTSLNWNQNGIGYIQELYNANTSALGNGLLIKGAAGSTNALLSVDYGTAQATPGTALFRVLGSGNVGIGTATPGAQLSNNSLNTVDAGGVGEGPTAMNWNQNGAGYIQELYNANTSASGNGLLIKGAGNSTNALLSVDYGSAQTTAGTSIFRVLGNGNVGIGTASPGQKLTVTGASNGTAISTASTIVQSILNSDTTANNWVQLGFGDIPHWAGSIGFQITDHTNGYGDFAVATNSAGGYTEKFRVTSVGNIGIGTTSPTGKLHVIQSGGSDYFKFSQTGLTNTWGLSATNNGTQDVLGFGNVTAGNFPMVIGANGNVGIGTSSPINTLTLGSGGIGINSATATNSGGIGAGQDSANSSYNFSYTNSFGTYLTRHYGMTLLPVSGGIETYLSGFSGLGLMTAGANRLYIANTGNVGIGTTSPGAKVHIYYGNTPATAAETLRLEVTGNVAGDRGPFISFFAPNAGGTSKEAADIAGVQQGGAPDAGGALIFKTSAFGAGTIPSERVRIDSSGNVGIGMPPGFKLDLLNTSSGSGSKDIVAQFGSTYVGGESGATVALKAGAVVGGALSGVTEAGGWPGSLIFYSHSSTADNTIGSGVLERMRINSSGNVGIGTTSPSSRLHIYYPDTYGTALSITGTTTNGNGLTVDIPTASGYTLINLANSGTSRFNVTAGGITNVVGSGNMGATALNVSGGRIVQTAVSNSDAVNITNSNSYGNALTVNTAHSAPGYSLINAIANGTSRFWVDTAGKVGINDVAPGANLSVVGNASIGYASGQTAPANGLLVAGNVGIGTATPSYQLQLSTDSAAKPGTSTWTIASDSRLKDIRGPFTRGLAALEQIHPIYFKYKTGNELLLPTDKEFVGIIAQDAQRGVPEAVSTDESGYLHVTNDSIIWTMFNSIKELYAKFKGQDREIASLKSENAELKTRMDQTEKENAAIKTYLCSVDPKAPICQ